MNKSDITIRLQSDFNTTRKKAEMVVDLIFDKMSESLASGERIEIRGFGSFKIKDYPGYEGRNPKNGEVTIVSAKKLPVFKVGKVMRELVDKGKDEG